MSGQPNPLETIAVALHDGLEYFGHELDDVTGRIYAPSPQAKKYDRAIDALAQVETLVEAARPLTDWDLHACQWIYLDPGTAFRGLPPEDAERIIKQMRELGAALAPFVSEGETA